MSGDAIIVPTFDRERQSAVALSRIDRSLRSNGILVIGTASGGATPHTRQIPALLIQHGFSLVRSRIEPVGPDILCCRKLPILHAQAA